MKKYIQTCLFIIILLTFVHTSAYGAGENQTPREQILQMSQGEKLIEKIDMIATKIVTKTKDNPSLHEKIVEKVQKIQDTYSQKTDTKSQKIVIIFQYLETRIGSELRIENSTMIQRLERVELEKYKKLSSSRVNKVKKQKYQRISIKK